MDQLVKFIVGTGLVRGAIVRCDSAWIEAQARRGYPVGLGRLLGEMLAGSSLLAASIKFEGTLILQMMGEGCLRMAVAECAPGYALRGTAKWHEPWVEDSLDRMLGGALGGRAARCVITLDPRDGQGLRQPYQGVVALADDQGRPLGDLAAVLANYMHKSEQIDTRFVLACDERRCAGLMIQRMPKEGGVQADVESDPVHRHWLAQSTDAFAGAQALLATVGADELLASEPQALLQRLFWEPGLHAWSSVDDPQQPGAAPHFACSCSRERVGGMLRMLGRAEVEALLDERGVIDVGCDFCGKQYRFDAVDAAQALLADAHRAAAGLQ